MMSLPKARFKKYRDFLFTQREFLSGSISGFSLIELMAAAAIVGVLGLAISSMSTTAFKAASISNGRQDLASLQMLIREQVSCPLTLGLPLNHDFSVPVPCAGPYLLQKNSPSGAVQLGATISGDSERTQIGNYKVRASCVANQLQIMVESTRKDPITNTILPPRNLFAGAGGNGLCSQFFTGATCPTGRVVTGVANGIPVCSAAAACPSGQVQTGTANGVPVCGVSGGCPTGQVEIGRVNNQSVCTVPDACPAGVATIGYSMKGVPICSWATSCPAGYNWVGVSNGLPVCLYTPGSCPAGTWDQGHRAQGFIGVCSPRPPNPVETWASGSISTYVMPCSIPTMGGFFPTSHMAGTAYCPGGYSAVSGHVSCNGASGGIVQYSQPAGSNGWSGACCTPTGTGGTITIRCRAD